MDFIVPEANLIPFLTFEGVHFAKFHFHHSVFPRNTGLGTDILFIDWSYIARSLVKIKSIPDCHLFITQKETKWTKWYAMTSHVIAYRSLELLFGTHTFHYPPMKSEEYSFGVVCPSVHPHFLSVRNHISVPISQI